MNMKQRFIWMISACSHKCVIKPNVEDCLQIRLWSWLNILKSQNSLKHLEPLLKLYEEAVTHFLFGGKIYMSNVTVYVLVCSVQLLQAYLPVCVCHNIFFSFVAKEPLFAFTLFSLFCVFLIIKFWGRIQKHS